MTLEIVLWMFYLIVGIILSALIGAFIGTKIADWREERETKR